MAVKESKIIFITSVKGGVGKTNVVLNLAGMYERLEKKVLIMDLDLYSSNIALSLKLDKVKDLYDIVDDLNNNKFNNVDDYICKYDDSIDVICSPKDPRNANKIIGKYIDIILSKIKNRYDIILIDSNYFLNDVNLNIMEQSSNIVYVINNDPINLKNMRTMVSIYNDMDKNNYKIILNNSNNKTKNYYTSYDMNHIIGKNIDYVIGANLCEKNIDKYILSGYIQTLKSKNNELLKTYERIANGIIK